MANISELLAARNLTGVVQEIKSGLFNPLPADFFSVTGQVRGQTCEWKTEEGQQQSARFTPVGAKARERDQIGMGTKTATMVHAFERLSIPGHTLANLLNPDTAVERDILGNSEINRQLRSLKTIFSNLRIAAVCSVLSRGHIWFDGNGNILPDATGAVITVDFGIPAHHLNMVNTGDFLFDVQEVKQDVIQTTGYVPRYALYGQNVPNLVTTDAVMFDLLKRNNVWNQQFTETGKLPAMLDLIWVDCSDLYFVDQNGTSHTWFGADQVVFLPEVNGATGWYGLYEGSDVLPGTMDIGSAENPSVIDAFGMFAYGCVQNNPTRIDLYGGDSFLPIIRNPHVYRSYTIPSGS